MLADAAADPPGVPSSSTARRRARALRLARLPLLTLLLLIALAATAAAEEEPPIAAAKEESGVAGTPPASYALPVGSLSIDPAELLAARFGQRIRFEVRLTQAVGDGALLVTVPRRFVETPASGSVAARLPQSAEGDASVDSAERTIELAFHDGRAGDTAAFALTDRGIPAGSYDLPLQWRAADGTLTDAGSARIVLYAPVREADREPSADSPFGPLRDADITQDAGSDDSETHAVVVPGDPDRVAFASNGTTHGSQLGGGVYVSNDGGAGFTFAALPATHIAPGGATEANPLGGDPMFAASPEGDIWYGGLTRLVGDRSRIVVNRLDAGTDAFQAQNVALPRVDESDMGQQDKNLMTIDDSPSSPTYGRLYVVWGSPASGGTRMVLVSCDTRVAGVYTPQRCDDPDSWEGPVVVSPSGSQIYADVAVGVDGTVYFTWWDYSSANAIVGASCRPAADGSGCLQSGNWTHRTIALLNDDDSAPVPFACPLAAQPGGRAAPQPHVATDVSDNTAHSGRVYVVWGDLQSGSGTTTCTDERDPLPTDRSFDSFVASASGQLPGGAAPSASVGTRLLTDSEGGGAANADDWFPWLTVDQATGRAWASLYSTRRDPARRKVDRYVREVTPNGSGHDLGQLVRATTASSDLSANDCCDFGNDYGDYEGMAADSGFLYPVWADARTPGAEPEMSFVRLDASEPGAGAGDDTFPPAAASGGGPGAPSGGGGGGGGSATTPARP